MLGFRFRRALLAMAFTGLLASPAAADDTADAAALLASGNRHLESAVRLRGPRRTRELEAALADYDASLRVVRSRNVIFNASLALEMLGRNDDAFNFLIEYLAVPGLAEDERGEATRRIDALRPNVAVLIVASEPAGAEVWIDRRDLGPRGTTPMEIAVAAGDHQLWLRAPGHGETELRATSRVGSSQRVSATLTAQPVSLQVLAPDEASLTLDGAEIASGAHIRIAPGSHVIAIAVPHADPVERRFEVLPGAPPMVIDLSSVIAAMERHTGATIAVTSNVAGHVEIDGSSYDVGPDTAASIPVSTGPHEVTVQAPGFVPYRTMHALGAGTSARLTVDLARDESGGLELPRWIFAIGAIAGLLGSGAASVAAMLLHQDYDRCTQGIDPPSCAGLADQTDRWNLIADVGWAVTAALGVTAIVLVAIDDGEGSPSTGQFQLVARPSGGLVAFSMPLGAGL